MEGGTQCYITSCTQSAHYPLASLRFILHVLRSFSIAEATSFSSSSNFFIVLSNPTWHCNLLFVSYLHIPQGFKMEPKKSFCGLVSILTQRICGLWVILCCSYMISSSVWTHGVSFLPSCPADFVRISSSSFLRVSEYYESWSWCAVVELDFLLNGTRNGRT